MSSHTSAPSPCSLTSCSRASSSTSLQSPSTLCDRRSPSGEGEGGGNGEGEGGGGGEGEGGGGEGGGEGGDEGGAWEMHILKPLCTSE